MDVCKAVVDLARGHFVEWYSLSLATFFLLGKNMIEERKEN